MADDSKPIEAGVDAAEQPRPSLLVRAREWTAGSPLRRVLVGAGLLGLAGGTIAVWLVLASLAAPQPVSRIEVALEKLDEGDLEYAQNYVHKMQEAQTILTQDYGGPLFVLGAVRAKQAASQWAPERRRRDYLVAAKYLEEALSLGVPEDREYQAYYLLGKSFIGSDQLDEGVDVLVKALDANPAHQTEIHSLLATAQYFAAIPDYEESLKHIQQVLADPSAPEELRGDAKLRLARTLSRLDRHEEAEETLTDLPQSLNPAQVRLTTGHVLIDSAVDTEELKLRDERLERAEQQLIEAERLDKLSTEITAGSQFLRGRISQLRREYEEAIQRYTDVRKRFGMSPAGVAASAAEGDIYRVVGNATDALTAYRRAMDAVDEMAFYQSDLLPIDELKKTMLGAHATFVEQGKYDEALSLIEQLGPLIGETYQLELRAQTQQRWGEMLIEQSLAKSSPVPELERQGRQRLREAGVSYENLATQRFAEIEYPEDLWRAAEAYYSGQSYTSATRVLRDYIKNEPLRYNAQALLRLGQSLLALHQPEPAVEAFEECIEFHPYDAAVYGARLAAARAHREQGDFDRAEQLLKDNLIGGTLSPRSPEWRDSKFELGSLLHEVGRHTDAIDHLEEAIDRYEDDPGARQLRTARYLVAESYRNAAEEPRQRYIDAKAVNEREKNEQEFRALLKNALQHYDTVQREISRSSVSNPTEQAMLRNCYMLKGSVLFDLGRYREAVEEYSNVSALYQNEPFVLETLLQISYCWRRLGEPEKARGNIDQAILALNRLPDDVDLLASTTRSRAEWDAILSEIRNW
ncbi:MAG: tetratricopeptide repeat protein [Planctomycetota bacterium]